MTKLFVPYEAVIKTASQLSNSIIKDYLNNPQIMQDVMHKIKEYYRDNTFFPTKNPMVYYDTVAQLVKGIKALSVQLNVPELSDVAYIFNNALSQVGPTYGPDTYKDIAENQQNLELIGMIVENVYEALSC